MTEAEAQLIADLLRALKICAPYMHAQTDAKGKADYSVVRDAIDKATAAPRPDIV